MGELLKPARHCKWGVITARHYCGRIGTGDEINEMVVNFYDHFGIIHTKGRPRKKKRGMFALLWNIPRIRGVKTKFNVWVELFSPSSIP